MLPLDFVIKRRDTISQVRATSSGVYWLAGIAAEDGRITVRRRVDGETVDVTPDASVRTRVMEYGGGAFDAELGTVVFNDDRTNQIFILDEQGARALTPPQSRYFYGGLHLHLEDGVVVAVREDHDATPEPKSEVVAIPLDGGDDVVVATGADFYAGPRIRDGVVAWQQWDHPYMSWDTSSIWTAPLDNPESPHCVFAADGVSAQHPMWLAPGVLAYTSDESGYWNWHVVEGDQRRSWMVDHDCDTPVWVLDRPSAVAVDRDVVAAMEIVGGYGRLALWQPSNGGVTYPLPGTVWINSIATYDSRIYVIADFADRPSELIELSPTGTTTVLAGGEETTCIAKPVSHRTGLVQTWFYAPPGVERPPLIVKTHGGPTTQATASFDEEVQFWLSRGFAVADVNYRGSTGFGREYRDALKLNWGIADVEDVVAVVEDLAEKGRIDRDRVAIKGGSAGGYTTLQALVTTDVFAAGLSRYGIGDLETLLQHTHKAESRYPFSLVGPWPEAEATYRERSPIHHLDRLRTPMLILQGLEDKVVPPQQAYEMADAVRRAGKPLAVVTFEDEGHGFRALAARREALEAEVSFLEQVFGLPLSEDVPKLQIENL
ncbi:alpha/beta hydrolase family protein [Tessaracoccus oleiagri]|uniref:Dipeptidyl aminopeptidase/acylaminoacyl peptidase n=1 Tax=Tessaracoccus oleiagri TaxID=686624 RepID=A0A1G9LX79_9ACTN|nr:prolyl oligopeptidase family serine peptidase [Tessaracoccus oleiagri]SDL66015.1 Dipeptidyl aminopeptidase/acylaminoacyl peptidase [Tessaracoccus oleiagri]